MRTFDHPNLGVNGTFLCPICGTAKDAPVVLVRIDGTEKDGIMEAEQVHLDCIDLHRVVSLKGEYIVYHCFDPTLE